MITFRFSKINLAVDVGAAPTLPVSKTDGLLLSQSTIIHARLFPNCQCLSTVKRPPALLACVYSRALATLHAVRKETTMKTTAVIGSTTNPIPYKGGEMSKQTLREGPMGKDNHRREGPDLK